MQTPASSAPLAILVPGKVLLDFVQTGFETKHDQVVVSGTLTVSDRTDFRNPKNIPFTWFAVRDTVRGEFTTDWIFGKNANVPGFDAKNPGLDKALTKHVQDHVEKVWLAHAVASAVVATPVPVEGAPVAPEPVDPAAPISPVPDTSFPPDWSIRAAVAHPIAPKPPKAPRPPKPPKPPKEPKPPRVPKVKVAKVVVAPPPEPVVPAKPQKYEGKYSVYEGECVCEELFASNLRRPFNWQLYTEGKFARRCFKCSCGMMWWQNHPSEEFWTRVDDVSAWDMLTHNEGVPTMTMAYLLDVAYLSLTLRHMVPDQSLCIRHNGE